MPKFLHESSKIPLKVAAICILQSEDTMLMKKDKEEFGTINLGRHETHCKVCQHPERETIEQEWLNWGNSIRIVEEYNLSRYSLYRHAHALGLFAKRQRNIRKALEHIIERAEDVEVTASAIVSAIQAYAKINANGQWIDRVEGLGLNELFDKMSRQELEAYAKDGILPAWFTSVVGATSINSQGEENNEEGE